MNKSIEIHRLELYNTDHTSFESFIEGSLEAILPTIWTVEKQR